MVPLSAFCGVLAYVLWIFSILIPLLTNVYSPGGYLDRRIISSFATKLEVQYLG
jgi:hypothetical protein